jgi:hypothetical protein
MPMSASESELPPLISLQTNYVPGPMVYRDWTIFDSGTQRHIMNSPESFLPAFQSQHFVLHGDTYTPVLGQRTTRIIATSPEGEVGYSRLYRQHRLYGYRQVERLYLGS